MPDRAWVAVDDPDGIELRVMADLPTSTGFAGVRFAGKAPPTQYDRRSCQPCKRPIDRTAPLRLGAAGCRGEHQGPCRLPRPYRSGAHASGVHAV